MTILLFKVQKLKKNYVITFENRERCFFRFVTSVGQRKKILSPHEEPNLRPSDSALRCSTTEPQRLHGKRGILRSSWDTRVFVNCLPTQEKCYRCPVL